MKEEELDIEELETILGIQNKTSEINTFLSKSNSNPNSFLQAIISPTRSSKVFPLFLSNDNSFFNSK